MLVVMRGGSLPADLESVITRLAGASTSHEIIQVGDQTLLNVTGAFPPELVHWIEAAPAVAAVVTEETRSLQTSDLRIASTRPLLPPAVLVDEMPLPAAGAMAVLRARETISQILNRDDDRLLVIVGPCSVHDPAAALDYAQRLASLAGDLQRDLFIVMRVYFEKPRTTVGWKGLINDPNLDGGFAINDGLRLARRLLLDLTALGLPVGCEFLDPILPQFIADIVSWGAIGARTTESQVHRELASALSMPVGFKNGTGGDVQIAVDAVRAAAYPHHFLSVSEQGLAAIVATRGNADCHVILRGGNDGPNYDAITVGKTLDTLAQVGLPRRLMIDTSHGNSAKDYRRQPVVAADIGEQIGRGETGITGVLMESFLVEGRQNLIPGVQPVRGQSVTDGCMSWEMTETVLRDLAGSVQSRRTAVGNNARPEVVRQ